MNNPISEMRQRLKEGFSSGMKPAEGLDVKSVFRPTANDAPRLPQSRIPSPKPSYDRAGRPPEVSRKYPEITPITTKKPNWGGWL
jgi:hypothetical protein